jgi:transposase
MIRAKDQRFHLRKAMARHAREHSIRDAAHRFAVSRNTLRKWLRRLDEEGLEGLKNRSTRPRRSPNQVSAAVERRVIEARLRSGFGAARLIEEFELPCGLSAVRRILRQHGLTKKPRKKHQKKNDLREAKARYKPLERLQMDVKYLCDLEHFWPQAKRLGLPLFQYTVRDVKSGALWLAYGHELCALYAELTLKRLLKHFKDLGLDIANTVVKTDNGTEFKGQQRRLDSPDFSDLVAAMGASHRYNPPSCPNANADVESSHSLIEPEFFDRENFRSIDDFFSKTNTYQTYFNVGRPNRWKHKRTPWEIIYQDDQSFPLEALLLPPVLTDSLLDQHLERRGVGHQVSPPPVFASLL